NACTSVLSIIPGTVGPGMATTAGSGPNRSGGAVIHVTTLADSGPGSLREALQTNGPRIVVFDVSGYIMLQGPILVSEPYLTIAGQTSPYPGISLRGTGLIIVTHDVLIQHIRIRVGDDPNGPNPRTRDALAIFDYKSENDVYNIVIDHVSMSWAIDENVDTASSHDISVTNCIISEALWHSIHPKGPHSKGYLVGPGARDILVSGNLFAHNEQRIMRVQGDSSTLFVNNIVYNWHGSGGTGAAGVYSGTEGTMDASIVGNVYVRGLDTRPGSQSIPIYIASSVLSDSRFYVDDNEAAEKSSDPWSVVRNDASSSIKVGTPPNWPASLTAKKGNLVENWVLDHAGARRADGEAVDLRIISDVRKGTGRIIDSQEEVGSWPPLANNVRGTGGIPALSIPSNEIQASGYTKIEEWLHHLARQVEVPK
ncbi:MAG: hypothetical protein IID17_11215, partial [Nitrospinae bacterium]|nr:hypothetical protein [Nitrospinota bacterium]